MKYLHPCILLILSSHLHFAIANSPDIPQPSHVVAPQLSVSPQLSNKPEPSNLQSPSSPPATNSVSISDLETLFKSSRSSRGNLHPDDHPENQNPPQLHISQTVDSVLSDLRATMAVLTDMHNTLLHAQTHNQPRWKQILHHYYYAYPTSYAAMFPSTRPPAGLLELRKAVDDLLHALHTHGLLGGIDVTQTGLKRHISHSTRIMKDAVHRLEDVTSFHAAETLVTVMDDMWRKWAVLDEKWSSKFSALSKKVKNNLVSNEYVSRYTKEIEVMMSEFTDEFWRLRTEWMYRGADGAGISETFNWLKQRAEDTLKGMTEKSANGMDGLSTGVKVAKDMVVTTTWDTYQSGKRHTQSGLQWTNARDDISQKVLMVLEDLSHSSIATTEMVLLIWQIGLVFTAVLAFAFVLQFFKTLFSFGKLICDSLRKMLRSEKTGTRPIPPGHRICRRTSNRPHVTGLHVRHSRNERGSRPSHGHRTSHSRAQLGSDKRLPAEHDYHTNPHQHMAFEARADRQRLHNSDQESLTSQSRPLHKERESRGRENAAPLNIGRHQVQMVYETVSPTMSVEEILSTASGKGAKVQSNEENISPQVECNSVNLSATEPLRERRHSPRLMSKPYSALGASKGSKKDEASEGRRSPRVAAKVKRELELQESSIRDSQSRGVVAPSIASGKSTRTRTPKKERRL